MEYFSVKELKKNELSNILSFYLPIPKSSVFSRMQTGRVIESTGSWYTIKKEDGSFLECRIKGKFRIKGIKSTNPVAVGDQVEIDLEEI